MTVNTVVVVHGKCEMAFCQRLGNILRMPMVLISRQNGEEAITISQLPTFLSEGAFRTEISLHRMYPSLDYNRKDAKPMGNLRIFTIMDTDMDFRSERSYLSKDLLRCSPFHDRIVPILNRPNMDHVMEMIGMGTVVSKKTRSYAKMMDGIVDPLELLHRLENCEDTNLDLFVRHCLSCRPPYQNRVDPLR